MLSNNLSGYLSTEFLPSWSDGEAKKRIINFVESVVQPDSPTYVPEKKRIAVFDNDGTLCVEQPRLVHAAFVHDLAVKRLKEQPELEENDPIRIYVNNPFNYRNLIHLDRLREMHLTLQSGMTEKEYKGMALKFLAESKNPHFDKYDTELAYKPMLELMQYLKAKRFRVYINTAGGTEFVRVFAKRAYGIQPNKVIGTPINLKYEFIDGQVQLKRLGEYALPINHGAKKVENIQRNIGRLPILAVGNMNNDIEMLTSTKTAKAGLAIFLKHDDSEREFEYSKDTEKAIELAEEHDWLVVSMKNDFRTIF